ncbi:MAG: aminotransferase class I/II-fold pyridoxal phosphate-dependent enzyme [bacterium]|nr:aminotransferase class I/II-fold pyridoxal phosphate-dependent enzyme [bacterium]
MKPAAKNAVPVGGAYRRQPAPPGAVRLDANEGPAPDYLSGRWPGAIEALRRYPDTSGLEADLAARFAVPSGCVLVTAGGDGGIDRLCRRFLGGGRELVLTEPTFEMFARHGRLAGGRLRTVSWWEGAYPVAAVAACVGPGTGLLAVVSPNNPTGAVVTAEELGRLRRKTRDVPLLLDAAYAEFADEDLTRFALTLPRTLVLRTLSKAWGLAGLRIGCLLGPEELIAELRGCGQPYAVSGPSVDLAREALATGAAAMEAGVAFARASRKELTAQLTQLGAQPLPSKGNFVLCRPRDAAFTGAGLAALGVSVRAWPGHGQLDQWLRITCPGHEAEASRLTRALDVALAPQALLLDMDGVIADEGHSYRACIGAVLADHGFTVTREQVAAAKAVPGANDDWEVTRRLLLERGLDVPLAQVVAEFQAHYLGGDGRPGLCERESLIPSRRTLAELAARLPLGIVTGRPRAEALRFLDRFGLSDLFACMVSRDDAAPKPDPAPVREALRRLGIERAWMVGDTPDDITAARAAGVLPIGIRPPAAADDTGAALEVAGAARIITTLDELKELLP